MMSVQPAAEAKKAEGASWVPLLTPTGPYRKRRLRPGEVILNGIDISYVSQESSNEEGD